MLDRLVIYGALMCIMLLLVALLQRAETIALVLNGGCLQ